VDDHQTSAATNTTHHHQHHHHHHHHHHDDDVAEERQVQVVGGGGSSSVSQSLTLPRIEHVLRSEGVRPVSISQQIDSLQRRTKLARYLLARYVAREFTVTAGFAVQPRLYVID